MPYNPVLHHRRSIRLQGYDYAHDGVYFTTICTVEKRCVFGDVINEQMRLNQTGEVVAKTWAWLQEQYDFVELDEWIVMPNHLHGILVIHTMENQSKGGSRTAPTENMTKVKPLGRLIGAFKTVSTKQIKLMQGSPQQALWQRNYYEHIIRNEVSLNAIREYIQLNPVQWALDKENPSRPL
jgi:REP element-mobilizing transposase RayT